MRALDEILANDVATNPESLTARSLREDTAGPLPLPSRTTSSPHDLVGLVMQKHGVTKERAQQLLIDFGM